MVSDMPFGATAIGGRINENPLHDDDDAQRRAAAITRLLVLLRLRLLFFTMVTCFFLKRRKIKIEDEEGSPAINKVLEVSRKLVSSFREFLLHKRSRPASVESPGVISLGQSQAQIPGRATTYIHLCTIAQIFYNFSCCTLSSNHSSFHMPMCSSCCFRSSKKEWFYTTLQVSVSIVTCKVYNCVIFCIC